jgi:hypothetical protein
MIWNEAICGPMFFSSLGGWMSTIRFATWWRITYTMELGASPLYPSSF